MGVYVNPGNEGFNKAVKSKIYVDKTGLIPIMNDYLCTENQFVCVSRPRRFGKSMALNMLVAYYSCGCDSEALFKGLMVERDPHFREYLNKYNVIYWDMTRILRRAKDVDVVGFLEREILRELWDEYPGLFDKTEVFLPSALEKIYAKTNQKFIFLIDEWDCVMRERSCDEKMQKQYLDFLRDLLKGQWYVALAYMTGILPIKKYGVHSALNMFMEHSMTNQRNLEEYTGFTEGEVKAICEEYNMDFDEVSAWYDGYAFRRIKHVYNPMSVVEAMLSSYLESYWTLTETYEALKRYIDMDFDGLRGDIAKLLGGCRVAVNIARFKNDMVNLASKDDVLALLVHLGYLAYDQAECEVYIPNREIAQEFVNAMDGSKWKEVVEIVNASEQLLKDTIAGKEQSVADALDRAHEGIASILTYNNEADLAAAIRMAYFVAGRDYGIVRELPTGKGYADLAFIPLRPWGGSPALVIELKFNKSADTAIKQIKDNRYTEALASFSGEIVLAGINYDKETKKHMCKIERVNSSKGGRDMF